MRTIRKYNKNLEIRRKRPHSAIQSHKSNTTYKRRNWSCREPHVKKCWHVFFLHVRAFSGMWASMTFFADRIRFTGLETSQSSIWPFRAIRNSFLISFKDIRWGQYYFEVVAFKLTLRAVWINFWLWTRLTRDEEMNWFSLSVSCMYEVDIDDDLLSTVVFATTRCYKSVCSV
jgi:hypothetical protein